MAATDSDGDRFAILRIQILPEPSFPHPAVHEIRVRRNAPKIPTANDSRSLFLKNVPVDSTEPHFRAVFTQLVGAGKFERVDFDDDVKPLFSTDPIHASRMNQMVRKRKRDDVDAEDREANEAATLPEIWSRHTHRSSGTAVVLLADDKSVQLVLNAIAKSTKSKKYPVWGEDLADPVPSLGAPWIASHLQLCRGDKSTTQSAVHAFFNTFNRKEKEAAALARQLRNEPDEDGFVTVTRGARAAPATRFEAEEAKQKMLDKQAKRKLETKDFYRFQSRQRRKEDQAALLRRFDEDKKRVNAMKEKRGKFKPQS